MAAAAVETPVNGNYAAQPNYQSAESYQPAQSVNPQASSQSAELENATPTQNPSSTEIGWYFVEQYYNTMSKEPGKLFLFYTRKSQFVAGNEAEKVNVAVGHKKISEMIQKMDIQDCKVRVTNVDTQQSGNNILVQVIGEMSNRAAPHRKFVQTFVLAEQPTGYFVLNDIFRNIVDDEEEDEPPAEEGAGPLSTAEPISDHTTLTSSKIPAEKQRDVEKVDQKLQQSALEEPKALPTVVKGSEESRPTVEASDDENNEATKHSSEQEERPTIEQAAESAATEEVAKPEKPRDPEPTPLATSPKPAKAVTAEASSAPPKPTVPKTWANLVASKGTSAPQAPNPARTSPSSAPAPASVKATNPTSKENSTSALPANDDFNAKPQTNGGAAWQNVGSDKQRQNRQHSQSISSNQDNVLGYVKNVTEKVDQNALRATLAAFGKLAYFDVSRPKNCAFVEFADPAAYSACVSANPHTVSGEQVFVEERRPRAAAYGGNFNPRGGIRGGRGGPNDRPGNQGRGGFNKDGGRGGFVPRGRGGTLTPRGRGQPQAA